MESYSNKITLLTMNAKCLTEETCYRLPNGEQRFICPLCQSVKYIQLRQLKSHIKECGSIFKCCICNQIYKQKRSLKQHIKRKHSKIARSNGNNMVNIRYSNHLLPESSPDDSFNSYEETSNVEM